MSLTITAIETEIFRHGNSLISFICQSLSSRAPQEGEILAVTSKVVSLAEGRLISKNSISKSELIDQEAEFNLGEIGYGVTLTLKQGLFLPAAGIDESNSEDGSYILHPQDPFASAQLIRKSLAAYWGLKNFGVLLTDSRSGPLRRGVSGIALSFAGFHPLKNKIGQLDLFDRPLKVTQVNLVDSLAAAAVLMMGEANEQRPLALITNAPVEFSDDGSPEGFIVSPAEDMYLPLYEHLLHRKHLGAKK